MDDPGKYLINARIRASGVVERNDVVGAVFGQTEGLLGNGFDLRALQVTDRVGRIDVDIASEHGTSRGTVRIATDLDRVETAVLAASLETIERIGPCEATVEIDRIEDIRAAKRRQVFDRAQELVATGFEDVGVEGADLVEAVRAATEPVDIEEHAGYPAGPDIEEEDEIIIVEGRADVSRLLHFGITNVIGVEGTDVPEEVAALTRDRITTVFFDGDRGGDLLLLELAQIGEVDFVTFAPPGRSVEDLDREEVSNALAQKVPYEATSEEPSEPTSTEVGRPSSLRRHVETVLENGNAASRVLNDEHEVITTSDAEVIEVLTELDGGHVLVTEHTVGQREVDIAARRGIELVVCGSIGEFTKRPRDLHIVEADGLVNPPSQ